MQYLNVVISLYNLIIRALALAHSDPEFSRDWQKFEQSLLEFGVDIPGDWSNPAGEGSNSASKAASSQAVSDTALYGADALTEVGGSPRGQVVKNPDGSLSLNE